MRQWAGTNTAGSNLKEVMINEQQMNRQMNRWIENTFYYFTCKLIPVKILLISSTIFCAGCTALLIIMNLKAFFFLICLNIKLKSICHSVVYDDFKLFSPSDRQCWYRLVFKPDLSDSTDARFFSLSFGSVLRLHAYGQGICVCCMLRGQTALEGAVCTYLSNTDCFTFFDMHKGLKDWKWKDFGFLEISSNRNGRELWQV